MGTIKNIFFSLVLLSFYFQSIGQLNHLDTLCTWKEKWDMPILEKYSFFKIYGDTIINSNHYKKVHYSKNGTNFYEKNEWIREDSLNRIYLKQEYCKNEIPLYDFNLNKNDTFKRYDEDGYFIEYFIVISTDSIIFNGTKRKRIIFEKLMSDSSEIWIEGIGGNLGVLYRHLNFNSPMLRISLICITKHDSFIYRNPIFADCNPPLTIPHGSIIEKRVKIYPQPISNEFIIEMPEQSNYELIIFDSFGKMIIDAPLNEQISRLSCGQVKAGMYYYMIKSKEAIYKGKIVFN